MDKTAVITGGTKGIGKSIVMRLLNDGYKVVVNYGNSDSDAFEMMEELKEYKQNIILNKSDLSNLDGLNNFIECINDNFNTIDVLILNAGVTKREELEDITFDSWNYVMNTNLNIPFFIIQKMNNKISNNGKIIFISSVLGIKPDSISIQYGVSKAALISLTKYLVKYFVDRNITVNSICPGFVDTSWQLKKTAEHRKRIEDKIPLKRFAMPDEVAKTCIFLIENDYITGQNIIVDGGYSL